MIRLADYVIKYLKRIGVDVVFTVSGGGSIWLCDALSKKTINYICCHHEQAVGYSVEGYSRSKNNVGVGIVTTGPGGTNTISAVSSCWIDSVPAVFISGQVFLNQTIQKSKLRQKGVQEINIIDLVKPNTKFAKTLEDPNEIKKLLDYAFYQATNGRPGPCWIDIPGNFQNTYIDEKKLKNFYPVKKKISPDLKKISKISDLLISSKKPIFIFGHGCRLSRSMKIAKKITQKMGVPFALTWNASDFLDNNNKLFIGKPGAFAERGSNFIVQSADLIIAVGTRLPYMVTGYNSKDFGRNAKLVIVDVDNNELKNNQVRSSIKLNEDAKSFLDLLYEDIKRKKINKLNLENWRSYCSSIRSKYPILLNEQINQKKYVNSYYFVSKLSNYLKKNYQIVTDMGLSFVGTHQAFKVKENELLFTNSGHAPMGWGLPAAVGAYYANKSRLTICLTGEGGLMMNIQELSTIMHNKLPIKIFIYNNGGYLTIKQTQQLGFNSRIMGADNISGISFPDFKKISSSFNLDYISFNKNKQITNKSLNQILISKKPVICELFMDPEQEQMPKAINKRDKNGKTIPTAFENLYPFLDEKEISASLNI